MYRFLRTHWVAGAMFMACAMMLLLPVFARCLSPGVLLIYLHSPGYMIHQFEEHTGDRFRTYINSVVLGGREGLKTIDVLWINLGGVWALNLLALYAAAAYGAAAALFAPYLMLVNAVSHIATSARNSGYNPGVTTSILIFLPLSVTTLLLVPASLPQHLSGLAIAVLVHLLIIANVVRRLRTPLPA